MKKSILISFALLMLHNISKAQRLDENIYPLSPQTSQFAKYGNTPVSLFTGQIDLTIPIYTYKDNDFEIPLFLQYNSSGFIPNRREGIVGLNWAINAGGVITRQVQTTPLEVIENNAGLLIFCHVIVLSVALAGNTLAVN